MDISAFQPIEAITADTPEEADRLRGLAVEALDYIQGFSWCPRNRGTFRCSYVAASLTRVGSFWTYGASWTVKRSPRNR